LNKFEEADKRRAQLEEEERKEIELKKELER